MVHSTQYAATKVLVVPKLHCAAGSDESFDWSLFLSRVSKFGNNVVFPSSCGFAHNYCHTHSFRAHTHNTHRHLPDLFMLRPGQSRPSLWSFTARSLRTHIYNINAQMPSARNHRARSHLPMCAGAGLSHVHAAWVTRPHRLYV